MTKAMKRLPALLLGLFLMVFSRSLPSLFGLSVEGMQVLGIFLGAVILWLFVDITWPSVLALMALSLVPGVTTNAVLSASFGNATIWFLVFSFLITFTLSETGFLRRLALAFLNSRLARRGEWAFILMFLLAVLALGSFIAPTVTFLLFFALHKEVVTALDVKPGSALARALMVGTACVTSISCAMTPIAHTFPLMALGFHQTATGEVISYASYLKIGLPVGVVLFVLTYALLYLGLQNKVRAEGIDIAKLDLKKPGPLSMGEVFSALVFVLVIITWLLTGLFPKGLKAVNALGTAWPAMAGVVLLAAVPIKNKPVLDIKKGFEKGVSWASILLCAAALALGKYVSEEGYGITALIGQGLSPLATRLGISGTLLIVIAATILMTNFMSNIVTTTVMYNVSAAILATLALSLPGVPFQTSAILVGLCASLAFATPPAIAHIALAAGSDWASPKDMLAYGGLLAVISIPVVYLFTMI